MLETRAGVDIPSVSVRVFLKAVRTTITESNGQFVVLRIMLVVCVMGL